MYLTLIFLIIFFVSVAMLVREGLWSNTLTMVNVLLAGLVATSFWEPVADWLDGMAGSYTYLLDFLALWMLFCVAFVVLRAVSDTVSKVQVRFKKPVDTAGGVFMAMWVGWLLICFTAMTLHTAPLAKNFLGGGFYEEPDGSIFFGLNPDRKWLGLVHKVSQGSFATSDPQNPEEANTFDPQGEFVFRYYQRRADFEQEPALRVQR